MNNRLSFNYKFVLSNRCLTHQSTNQLLEDIELRMMGVNFNELMLPKIIFPFMTLIHNDRAKNP